MKIYLSCSKRFYSEVEAIKLRLESQGHFVTPPNGWNDTESEGLIQQLDTKKYVSWKAEMIRKNSDIVSSNEAVLVLNLDKGNEKNYIGGSTFLEAFKAFELGKKLFFFNPLPEGSLHDELEGFNPKVINKELELIK